MLLYLQYFFNTSEHEERTMSRDEELLFSVANRTCQELHIARNLSRYLDSRYPLKNIIEIIELCFEILKKDKEFRSCFVAAPGIKFTIFYGIVLPYEQEGYQYDTISTRRVIDDIFTFLRNFTKLGKLLGDQLIIEEPNGQNIPTLIH